MLHQTLIRLHLLHAQSQSQRHSKRQTFGHLDNDDRDLRDEPVQRNVGHVIGVYRRLLFRLHREVVPVAEREGHRAEAHGRHEHRQVADERGRVVELLCERTLFVLLFVVVVSRVQSQLHLPALGVHAHRHHDVAALSALHAGAAG